MGCSESKVEQQKAVALCHGRADLLGAAIRHRYALAAAHAAYTDSLLSVSATLHRLLLRLPRSSSSPVLPLPTRRKPEPSPPPSPIVSSAGHSHSGCHINFLPSDSDDDDDDDDSPFHSGGSSPVHHLGHYGTVSRAPGSGNIYYARSRPPPPPSVQPPQNYETIQVGSFEPYAAHSSYGCPHSSFPGYHGSVGGYLGPSSPPPAMPPPASKAASALGGSSSSRAPPPPPSPPRTSTWDFLNPFDAYDKNYHCYTPSRSSREVRDEEGIPDLEEEDQEVLKDAYGDQRFAAFSSAATREHSSMGASTGRADGMSSVGEGSFLHHARSAPAVGNSNCAPEVVDKKMVTDEVQKPQVEQRNVATPKKIVDDSEVANAIKAQFERASQCARELYGLLEVGKHQYHPKQSLYEVSSRMMGVMTPPSEILDFEDNKVMGSRSLASTLQKLHIWERKLYHEVRAEEKMRLFLNRSHKELRLLVERGAESHKIDSTRNLIKKFSTKIRIAMQVVASISRKINRLRDEELWPLTTELILGLLRMWNVMLECHQMQCEAISEAKRLDLVVSGGKLSGSHADEIMQLELEMLKWTSKFSAWVNAQRNYVKALNGWLVLCLHYEPEETADGVAPYSPGRIGAPPVFIICNCWSQAMDRASERGVLDSMQAFAVAVQQNTEQHERMIATRDLERWLRAMEKTTKYIHKEVDSLSNKLALVPGQIGLPIYQVEGYTAEVSSMQIGLEKLFAAMEDFTCNSVKAYEELLEHCGEQRMTRENAKVPLDFKK